jgi:hypothetical protein
MRVGLDYGEILDILLARTTDEDSFRKTAMSRREGIVSCIDVKIMDRSANTARPSCKGGGNHAGTLSSARAPRPAETEGVPRGQPRSSSGGGRAGHPYSHAKTSDNPQKRWKIGTTEGHAMHAAPSLARREAGVSREEPQ